MPVAPATETSRYALGDFWRQWFLLRLGGPPARLDQAVLRLRTSHPRTLALLRAKLPAWQTRFTAALRRRILPNDFWLRTPPLLRPFAGYLQLFLENADFSRESWLAAVAHLESLAASLAEA
jgi:hypothetical protein